MKSKQLVFIFFCYFEGTSKPLTRYIEFQLIDQNNVLSNHIAGFFDDQYLWRESIIVLDFLHRDRHQGREILKVILLVRCSQV